MANRDEPDACKAEAHCTYRSYLLRCWAEPQGANVIWRFSLEGVSDQARHGFADLPSLLKFLEGECDDPSDADL
ncbi:MAG: hypothetical protein KDE58_01810 [Caldilineaceae bacterium]|nr:hypothetical protein [Caldilineaceae bacterium]